MYHLGRDRFRLDATGLFCRLSGCRKQPKAITGETAETAVDWDAELAQLLEAEALVA